MISSIAPTKQHVLKEGLYESLGICLSFFFMFGATGSLYHQHGIPFLEAMLGSIFIFTTPLQIFLLHFPAHQLILFGLIATLVINSRFFMMATVMVPYFKSVPLKRLLPALAFFSASSFTVTYTYAKSYKNPPHVFTYYLGVAIPAFFVAQASFFLGYFFLKELPSPLIPFIFIIVLPVHFTALTAKRSHTRGVLFCTLGGFLIGPFIASTNSAAAELGIPILLGFLFAFYLRILRKKTHHA